MIQHHDIGDSVRALINFFDNLVAIENSPFQVYAPCGCKMRKMAAPLSMTLSQPTMSVTSLRLWERTIVTETVDDLLWHPMGAGIISLAPASVEEPSGIYCKAIRTRSPPSRSRRTAGSSCWALTTIRSEYGTRPPDAGRDPSKGD